MREQGWPNTLCQWVESFLTARRIRVGHYDGTTQHKVLEFGVPQGSPLSSLLFLLYIAILVQDEGKNNRFGYADDISILVVGSAASEAVAASQEEVKKLVHLADGNMIDFDPSKSELLVIVEDPKRSSTNQVYQFKFKVTVLTLLCVRWLGVWIDSQLNFKQHVQHREETRVVTVVSLAGLHIPQLYVASFRHDVRLVFSALSRKTQPIDTMYLATPVLAFVVVNFCGVLL